MVHKKLTLKRCTKILGSGRSRATRHVTAFCLRIVLLLKDELICHSENWRSYRKSLKLSFKTILKKKKSIEICKKVKFIFDFQKLGSNFDFFQKSL